MKDVDSLLTKKLISLSSESNLLVASRGGGGGGSRYRFWAFTAILLLLAFWSMFTGTLTLRWSTAKLNALLQLDNDLPARDNLDVLEMEEREKVVKHMWDVYTSIGSSSRKGMKRLPKFWQEAFEAAFEEMTSDLVGVREAAVLEIAKMSLSSVDVDLDVHPQPSPVQSTSARELTKDLKQAQNVSRHPNQKEAVNNDDSLERYPGS